MDIEVKKMRILNALIERAGAQELVDVGTEVLQNPLFVSDPGIKIITRSNREDVDDVLWTETMKKGYADKKYVQEVRRQGDMAKIYNSDAPVLSQYSFSANRYLAARIRDKSNVIGHIVVIEAWRPFQAGDEYLLATLCKAMALELIRDPQSMMQAVRYFSLFCDLLDQKIQTAEELRERTFSADIAFPENMSVAVIRQASEHTGISQYYVRQALDAAIPGLLSIVRGEEVILLCGQGKDAGKSVLQKLREATAAYNLKIGVSRNFSDIIRLARYYSQAQESIRLAQYRPPAANISFYNDVYVYHLLSALAPAKRLLDFCDPLLLKLAAYDREFQTEYMLDIESYLNSGRRIKQAAEARHIHKNTMYYRLTRIGELLELDLADEEKCFALQLSFMILRLQTEQDADQPFWNISQN
ncbi:MAG: helix-turn-helix domain-containing protein [Gracilibacteraceae bacterium]|jgi:sugar diacid utilization regulator|nr:helix-turn-helix domain-containing protein [Gracilibacteraceae bacterium]